MANEVKKFLSRRRRLLLGIAGLLAAGGGVAALRMGRGAANFPTAEVTRGEFADYVKIRAEVKAQKSVTLVAPLIRGEGGDPQILKLVKTGAMVKKGEVVVEFDTAKLRDTLAENRSSLKQAEAEIAQARAQARLQEEQDLTDLEKARYDVERARLDVSKAEILSKIDGEKNKLLLADAEQKLRQAEEKLDSDRAKAKADITAKEQKREKALFDVRLAEENITALTLRAPVDGMATVLPNFRAGGWSREGSPPFKEGDRAWSGAGIVELPELASLRVDGRVEEADRGRVRLGQPVAVRIDAVPDKEFSARVFEISPLAKVDFAGGWPFPRNFDVTMQLEQNDARVRPGMSATARVAVEKLADCILIPTEAVFQKAGKTVAYARHGSGFEQREIQIAKRGEAQVVVAQGLKPGERVALKDPTAAPGQ
jgi:multidrug efflux pump subunit AcrA (membrane-fusion protein)